MHARTARLGLLRSAATFREGGTWKWLYVALTYLDVVLTVIGTSLGVTELNPFMAGMLEQPGQLVLVRGALPVLVAWLTPAVLLIPAAGALAAISVWNCVVLASFLAG